MTLNKIDYFLKKPIIWALISFCMIGYYLSPLFHTTFYVPTYDNLDSNVIWYKILAESGKLLSDNHTIIPNMMSGLPRLSYGSEFDFVLWLYYMFGPKTAYILNEVLIHLIAFFSMFFFLKKYVAPISQEYGLVPIFVGSLYFALLPFWSGSGASIATLPLATYSLLNIRNKQATTWDWFFLILIPFYSSFILIYIFYILIAGIYFLYDTIKHKHINIHFLFAILLFGSLYLFKNYRLIEMLFFDQSFVSHRVEFNVMFNQPLWETYRLALVNFLQGHAQHAQILVHYALPLILIGMLLTFFKRKLTTQEGMVIWVIILLSFWFDIWKVLLIHKFTLPVIAIFSVFLFYYNKHDRIIPFLMLFIIFLSFSGALQMYEGLKSITYYIPLLKSFNFRMYFLLPFVYVVLFVFIIKIFFRTLPFSTIFSLLFIFFQFHDSLTASYFTATDKRVYASFESYYAPDTFKQIKHDINIEKYPETRFVSYGIEPAVSLYNDLYTIDGYSTNYPLQYKHLFKSVQVKDCLSLANRKKVYDDWGSKVYLLCLDPTSSVHVALHKSNKDIALPLFASVKGLCDLNTDYILSGIKLKDYDEDEIEFLRKYHDSQSLWHIWLYKLHCK